MNTQKTIVLAFGTHVTSDLIREIVNQVRRNTRLEVVNSDTALLTYMQRRSPSKLPGLIILDGPPVYPYISRCVDALRQNRLCASIPIVFLLPEKDITIMKRWIRGDAVYFYSHPTKPSEYKYYLREMLDLYISFKTV